MAVVQYSTVQNSTVQYSTVQYRTVQYSTVHIYTQTIQRTTQLTTLVGRLSGIRTQSGQTKINDELRKNYRLIGRVRAVPCLCELYPGSCLTTEEKAWKNLSVSVAEECQLAR